MSRNAENVTVEVFKEIQYYSHVIHLVSKVTGKVRSGSSVVRIAADTFPAGTLSGAPKHMAMTLISKYENVNLGFYGGAIGYLDFAGNLDFCIAIRTITIRDGRATVQAGAGIVADSLPRAEYEETRDKAQALLTALQMAEEGL